MVDRHVLIRRLDGGPRRYLLRNAEHRGYLVEADAVPRRSTSSNIKAMLSFRSPAKRGPGGIRALVYVLSNIRNIESRRVEETGVSYSSFVRGRPSDFDLGKTLRFSRFCRFTSSPLGCLKQKQKIFSRRTCNRELSGRRPVVSKIHRPVYPPAHVFGKLSRTGFSTRAAHFGSKNYVPGQQNIGEYTRMIRKYSS